MIHPFYFLLAAWFCIVNALYRPAFKSFEAGGFSQLASEGFGANYILWIALLIASQSLLQHNAFSITRLFALKGTSSSQSNQFIGNSFILKQDQTNRYHKFLGPLLFGGALCLMLVPMATLSWFAAGILAGYLFFKGYAKSGNLLLMLACLREPITATSLKLFSGQILNTDALLTNFILKFMGNATDLQSNIVLTETGHPLLILTGCSVFTNLSYVSLLWFALHVYFQHKVTKASWIVLGGILILTIISNSLRLALMTQSQQDYIFYHDGLGRDLFDWGLMLLVCCAVMGGCRHANES